MSGNVIIKQILLKRGNTAAASTYTGPLGEVVIDTDLKTLRIQDGLTAGGTLLSSATIGDQLVSGLNAANVQIANLWSNAATQANTLTTLTSNAATQSNTLSTLLANAAGQAVEISNLWANAGVQASTLSNLIVSSIDQDYYIGTLLTNAASQATQINSLTNTVNGQLGQFIFNGSTITTANNAGAGITINAQGTGEVHISDFVGINNPNPAYWLHVGNDDPDTDLNTGEIALGFSNGVGAGPNGKQGAIVIGWDWWDPLGNGTHNDGTTHSHFGFYKDGDYTQPVVDWDYDTKNMFVGNIIPHSNIAYSLGNSTHQWKDLWVSGNTIYIANVPLSVSNGTLLLNGNVITGGGGTTYSDANVAAYLPTSSVITGINANVTAANSAISSLQNNADKLVNGSYQVQLSSQGVLNLPVSQYNTSQLFAPINYSLFLGTSSKFIQIRGSDGAIVFADYTVQSTAYPGTSLLNGVNANVAAANAAIVTANTAMKSYVDAVTTAWTANAATQAGQIATLQGQVYTNTNTAAYLAGNVTTGNLTVSQNAVVLGNLRVQGTQTTVNAATLTVNDLFITVANGAAQASDANGAGIRVAGALANIAYSSVSDSFEFNKPITVGNIINNGHTWTLGTDGSTTFPNGAKLNNGTSGQFATDNQATSSLDLRDTQGAGFYTDSNGYTLRSNGTYNWIFGTDGILTTPGTVKTNILNNTGSNQDITIDPEGTNQTYIKVGGFDDGGERISISNQFTNSAGIYFYTETGTFRMYQNELGFPDGSWQSTAWTGTVANLTFGANVVSLGIDGNLTLPNNMIFTSSPAISSTGIIFGDGTYQRTAYQGPGPVLVNGTYNAALDGTGNLVVPGSILPNTDNIYDLGSATMRFRHLYVGPGTVYVGNAAIKTTVTGNLILPGLTRAVASSAFVEEIEDEGDQSYSFATNPTIIDNAQFELLSGGSVSSFTPATYSSTGIDGQGYIRNITVDTPGAGYANDVANLAEQNMWATEVADPINNFSAGDWIQIPFRAETRAGESEYEFSTGGGSDRLTNNGNEVVLESNGDLTLPANGAIIIDGGDGSIAPDGDDLVISWDNESLILKSVSDHVEVEADSDFTVKVRYDGSDYTGKWVFGNSNELVNISTDTGIVSEGGELRLQGGRDTLSSANVKIVSVNNGVAIHNWTFATTGNVVFPDGTEQSTAYTGGGGNANTGNVIFDGDTLYVGGVGFLDLDNSDNQIEIGSNNNGPVIVSVNEGANRWEFGANGVLALPPGGDIVNSNGASVLGGNTSTTNQLVNNEYTVALQSNGAVTIPGTIISGVTDPASYRGFYATVNQISEQDSDPSLNQIILSRSATMRGYNLSEDTNEDTFFANGITGSSHVAVINLYGGNFDDVIDLADIKTFVQTYIDLVLYDGTALRTDVADIQTAFAAAQTDLVNSLPVNALQTDFQFNEIQAVINTAGMTTSGTGSGFVYYYSNDTRNYSSSDETAILVPGTGYQVNDTITVPGTALGGIAPADNMTITVTEVNGSGGITDLSRSGSMDSDRFANLFVKHFVYDGFDDAYDQGNFIGTDRSECVFTATANAATERITVSAVTSGELAPFQVFWSQNEDNYNYMILHQVSGTAGGAGVYALGGYDDIGDEATATTYISNGIYYGINDPQYNSDAFGGGDYVSMVNTEVGIFTMVAVNADIDRISYLGETGADSDGVKTLTSNFDIGTGVIEYLGIELTVDTNTWTFENTGNLTLPQTSNVGITFGDGTFQKTAYKRPDNLMLDGGGAATIYEVTVDYAEGGFSSTRYGVNTPSFNGGGAELEEAIYYTLDGGGA